jgi:hypothetical protein
MNKSNEILQELNAISPRLSALNAPLPFEVPKGYFERFPLLMLSVVRNNEVRDSDDQSASIPDFMQSRKSMPFAVPDQYFDSLSDNLLKKIKLEENNPGEELKSISPLLAGMTKTNPFSLPENYFESLNPAVAINRKSEPAKIFTLGTWKRFAAAAIFAGIIFSGVVFYLNSTSPATNNDPAVALSEKAMEEFLSTDNFDILPEPLVEDDNNTMALLDINENTIREMLLTVDEYAIKEYINENPDADFSNKMN